VDVIDAVRQRRSIRAFTSDDVSSDDVNTLVAAAGAAPSAGNRQAYHLYVVRDAELRDQLAIEAAGQPFIATAPVVFVFCAEPVLNAERYGERGRDLYALQDVAAAVENVLLTATELGHGACWCGGFDEAVATRILDLPAARRPVAIVPIAHPAADLPPMRAHRPLAELTTYL
jgi:nitroreductase